MNREKILQSRSWNLSNFIEVNEQPIKTVSKSLIQASI